MATSSSKSLDPIVQPRGDSEAGADAEAGAPGADGPKKADAISQLCTYLFLISSPLQKKRS